MRQDSSRIVKQISTQKENLISAQIHKSLRDIEFNTRDYPIDFLVKEFQKGNFYISPAHERQLIWNDSDKSLFIESIILGYPIPMMFFADNDDGRFDIIDGVERTRALEEFANSDLILSNLKTLSELNGLTFKVIPSFIQRKFINTTLRVITFQDTFSIEQRDDLFNRINLLKPLSAGTKKHPTTHAGKSSRFIIKCLGKSTFSKVVLS
ncbi:MAG: DUF262 domain-containing protein [Deltaproteobacteria bacterium]|nr:DUF262 domain-containing protein [Deltaproteobacteria bacterium]